MGHKKVGVPNRRYTNEFKIEAVKLGQSVGVSEASRRLGIPDSSLFNWVKLVPRVSKATGASASLVGCVSQACASDRSNVTTFSLAPLCTQSTPFTLFEQLSGSI